MKTTFTTIVLMLAASVASAQRPQSRPQTNQYQYRPAWGGTTLVVPYCPGPYYGPRAVPTRSVGGSFVLKYVDVRPLNSTFVPMGGLRDSAGSAGAWPETIINPFVKQNSDD